MYFAVLPGGFATAAQIGERVAETGTGRDSLGTLAGNPPKAVLERQDFPERQPDPVGNCHQGDLFAEESRHSCI